MNDQNDKLNKGEMEELRRLVDGAAGSPYSLDDILAEYAPRPEPIPLTGLDADPAEPPEAPAPKKAKKPRSKKKKPPRQEPPEQMTLEELMGRPRRKDAPAEPERSAPDPAPEQAPDPAPAEAPEQAEAPGPEEPHSPTVDEIAAELIADETAPTVDDPREKGREDNVLAFPAKRRTLADMWRDLARKGDRYAEGMFSEEGLATDPEILRREELIPGVDQERPAPARRALRREDPPEPDVPLRELTARYSAGLGSLRVRSLLLLTLTLVALYLTFETLLPLPGAWLLPLSGQVKLWILSGLLAAGMALGWNVFATAARRLARGRLGMDTVLALACAATLADALTAPLLLPRQTLPCCALDLLALFFAVRGAYHERLALRLTCRTAASASEPYLVTLDEGKWNGRDTYTKHSGAPVGFGSSVQADDGARRLWRVFCPLLLLACLLLTAVPALAAGRPERIVWALSATLTAACPLAAPLVFARPFHRLARRLARVGGALAGWPGAAGSRRGDGIILTDLDLFPPGSVSLNGVKIFGQRSAERVVGYTATLIRASGCGLDKVFHDLLRSQGAIYREAQRLCCYEGGGLSADIRGDQVLVGSAAFMKLMDVELPQGLNVKNAVFCAIDGELAGIFALNYSLPDGAFPAVDALLREKLAPVLATRDFNVIPAMLRQRFHLAADRMDFPPVERRRELSDAEQPHSEMVAAVLCREGITPYTDSVVGARRLRVAVRLNAALGCLASLLGLLLGAYLTGAEAFASISPLNLLLYLLLWLVPSWLVMGWAGQF